MKKSNTPLNNTATYIESIGRVDRATTARSLRENGEGAAVRICFGATTEMPLRSLGYLASGIALVRDHLPKAQLQVIHPLHTAERVNGVSLLQAKGEAQKLSDLGRAIVERQYPDMLGQLIFATDTSEPFGIDEDHIMATIGSVGGNVSQKLESAAARRGSSFAPYVAAHLALHDTASNIQPLYDDQPDAITPHTVLSLGAQSERTFYEARMACRTNGVYVPGVVQHTGQFFTRHVLPPYIACRQGEPSLDFFEEMLAQPPITHEVPSVQRDLAYAHMAFAEAQNV